MALPCVRGGSLVQREETEERMREAIAFHLDGLREDGLPVPEPQASAASIAV